MARPTEEVEADLVHRTIKTAKVKQFSTYEPTALTLEFEDGGSVDIALGSVHYDMFAPKEGCLRITFGARKDGA